MTLKNNAGAIGGRKKSNKDMGNLAIVSSKGKEKMGEVPGAMEDKPGFQEPNDVFPQADGKKKSPGLEKDMESRKALSSDMVTDGSYAKKKNKAVKYDESAWNYKGKDKDEVGEPNEVWPDGGFSGKGVSGPIN